MAKAKKPAGRKLKVYCTPIGFHNAYVAAPSQKAALEAWGIDTNLFARGSAEEVTDPELTKEPLAAPGTVFKRLRGSDEELIEAIGEASARKLRAAGERRRSGKAKAAKAGKADRRPRPPKPSRAQLSDLEGELKVLEKEQGAEVRRLERQEQELARERQALERKQAQARRALQKKLEAKRREYERALENWRKGNVS